MKILFITDLYPVKNEEKSTPKPLLDFVEEWKNQGHTVDIIKPNFILNSFLRRKPFYKTGKINNVLNINYWTPFWFNVKYKFKNFDIDLKSYDTVIAHMPSGILFADKLNVPFVAGIHNSDLEVLTNPLYKIHFAKRERKAISNAKKIACRSFVIKDKLSKLFPKLEDKMFVAPSGINSTCNIFKKDFNNSAKLKILTCAHLKPRKNIDKLILACRESDDVELTVIGGGNLLKKLKKLDKNVNFLGYLEHDKVLEYMRNSDVFILPSINETFGMVYLEAMSQGCVTVCSENDGIAGIIKNGENGYLVKPDVESLKKLISDIKNTDKESLNSIRQKAFETSSNLTLEKCAKNYLQQIFKIF